MLFNSAIAPASIRLHFDKVVDLHPYGDASKSMSSSFIHEDYPSVDNLFNINRHLLRVDACFDPSIVINLHDFRENKNNNTNSKCVL